VKHKKIIINTICIAVFLIAMGLLWSSTRGMPKGYQWTLISLHLIRSNIQAFTEINGRHPDTLSEMNDFIRNSNSKRFSGRENMEHISSIDGCNEEHDVLNGQGGWYYNSQTGEVKVNLTKPLKEYVKNYYNLAIRYKVPSNW